MKYYEVYVSDMGYKKRTPLTYSSELNLQVGSIVSVPFGRKTDSGIVVGRVSKPEFNTKQITSQLVDGLIPAELLKLHEWLMQFYPYGSGSATQLLLPSGLGVKPRASKSPADQTAPEQLPPLTAQQQKAMASLASSTGSSLVYGDTGSGKTRIYLEMAKQTLNSGESSLVLVPEISLTPQIYDFFNKNLPGQIVLLHSGLTKSERNKNWLKILQASEPLVVIGTRSALFAPIKNLGFIAVDEMHEPSYKQESGVRYYALRVAAQLAKIHGAKILYASATPPLVEYFMAEQSGINVIRLDSTALPESSVDISVVDLKDTNKFTRHRHVADELLLAIERKLSAGEQVLLFLNRRGSFRSVLCQDCGWQALCPRCDIPLTYHGDSHRLVCHTCGYKSSPILSCPVCNSNEITYRSIGTKSLTEFIQDSFSEAIVKRFDTDNLADEKLAKHYEDIRLGKVDILIGTQMLGKGLDLPKLGLVAIINADTNLTTPDFSANERSYQLLHQAIGRVGRGHIDGEVILQTFNPDNPVIKDALTRDWLSMYNREVKERKAFGFPPYSFLMKISVSRKTPEGAIRSMDKLVDIIKNLSARVKMDEPTPSFYEKSNNKYNWQLVVRSKNRSELLKIARAIENTDYIYDLDPINLL